MIFGCLLAIGRWIDRLLGLGRPAPQGWPEYDPLLSQGPPVIDAPTAGEVIALSTHEAAEMADEDTARYGYTPPDLGIVDRSGLGIEPW